jgi:uncharacterized RDD family membrane protein YckC
LSRRRYYEFFAASVSDRNATAITAGRAAHLDYQFPRVSGRLSLMSTPSPNSENPYAPPKAFVQDVPGEKGSVEPASRGSRFGAYLVDSLVPLLLIWLPLFWGGLYDLGSYTFTPDRVSAGIWLFAAAATIALTVITIHLVRTNGQTLGKKALGIKVVRTSGDKASFARIFWLRNVVSILPSIVLGGLWTLIDSLFIFGESRQCVHDKIADTIVVNA